MTGAATGQDLDRKLIAKFSADAARVFRGRCVGVEPTEAVLPGARIAATRYTFDVLDGLKGVGGARRTSFVQVGVPGGGQGDLGRLAGLPTYLPGAEYVLFLLPESGRGLTSPAGAGEGALLVSDGLLHWLPAGHGVTERSLKLSVHTSLLRTSPTGAPGPPEPRYPELRYGTLKAIVAKAAKP